MIKQIGKTRIRQTHKGSCHCGAVEFVVLLPNGIEDPRHCDCSMCRRKGAVAAYVPLTDLQITKGADKLSLRLYCSFSLNPQGWGYFSAQRRWK